MEEKKPPPKGKAPPAQEEEIDLGVIPKDMLMEYFGMLLIVNKIRKLFGTPKNVLHHKIKNLNKKSL